ncbi:MAG TPA: hypothetical protein VFD60_01430 [Nitrososphaeraceae archaeon]|nr:hypothetical protein [Nitrososphaeraceae archaeon]
MKGAKSDKTKRRVGLTAVIFSLMGIILISNVFQISYADPPALRTLRIKVQLDKSVMHAEIRRLFTSLWLMQRAASRLVDLLHAQL